MGFVFWAKDVYSLNQGKKVTGHEKFSGWNIQMPERIF
tara:strand:+ start:405 stop:518 length:114 start_codon:yes stop_codon:yes gene_type:complete